MTYNDERKRDSMASSIILSSFYLDEILLKESSFEERVSFEETSLWSIASMLMKATKKNESL